MRTPDPSCQMCGVQMVLIGRNSALTKYCKNCMAIKIKKWNRDAGLKFRSKKCAV
ncbi:MAG: hypothetical protein ACKO7N_05360 [Candidatus Nitrosotenuis sp.]